VEEVRRTTQSIILYHLEWEKRENPRNGTLAVDPWVTLSVAPRSLSSLPFHEPVSANKFLQASSLSCCGCVQMIRMWTRELDTQVPVSKRHAAAIYHWDHQIRGNDPRSGCRVSSPSA